MASIVKRKNKYAVVYSYKDEKGNQRQKWETFDTNAEAKKRKSQIEFELQRYIHRTYGKDGERLVRGIYRGLRRKHLVDVHLFLTGVSYE